MQTRSDDLEILLTVVDSGGFSAAAEALDIQVARVSRAVSKVEKQLGVSILNRTTRRGLPLLTSDLATHETIGFSGPKVLNH
jgi:DNA-binding transcriptional LysR family regulator